MNLFELFEADTYQPPSIDVGDSILVGKFKNRKAKVTGFKKDDNNQPVLKTNKGDEKLFKPRIPKLMKEYSERITENTSISDLEFQFFVKEIMEETGAFVEAQIDRNEILINYVESGERGSGYRSLKMLLDFADKHSMKTLLDVLHGAPKLIEYYTKLGFSVDGVTKRGFTKWFSEYKKTWNIDDAEEITMFRLPKSKSLKETTFKAYHGSNSKIEGDFDEKLIGTGIDSSPFVGGVGMLGKGFYFTPSERKAADYGEHVVEAELTINNPLMIGKGAEFDSIHDAVNNIAGREVYRREFQDVLRKAGYDGIVKRDYYYPELDEIVVFDPKQIVHNREVSEAAPLRYHGTQASQDLNYRLRDNLKLKDDDHAAIKELDAMIAPLDQDMVLWRGVKSGFSAVKVGATIRDAGYVSASTSVDQAKVFALGDGAAILRISVKKGTPVIDLRAWEGENEIVIPRGAIFRIDEIIERPGRVPTILLTVV